MRRLWSCGSGFSGLGRQLELRPSHEIGVLVRGSSVGVALAVRDPVLEGPVREGPRLQVIGVHVRLWPPKATGEARDGARVDPIEDHPETAFLEGAFRESTGDGWRRFRITDAGRSPGRQGQSR